MEKRGERGTRLFSAVLVLILSMAVLPLWQASAVAAAETVETYEGLIIAEIVIVGNTRTDDSIILRQLPFKVGDQWTDAYTVTTMKRLLGTELFDPMNLKITLEPMGVGAVRVVIRVSDPHVLYNDPIEFAAMHVQELIFSSFYQTLHNPFGTGTDLTVGGRWGTNPRASVTLSQSLAAGWVMGSGLTWSKVETSFYRRDPLTPAPAYNVNGIQAQLSFDNYATDSMQYMLGASYRYANTSIGGTPALAQHYLLVGSGAQWTNSHWTNGWPAFTTTGRSIGAFDLSGTGSHYFSVSGSASGEFEIGSTVLSLTAAGGFMSEKAPLNHQYVMGGFGSLPLRGHAAGFIGNAYFSGILEYHVPVFKTPLWLIGFLDSGRMWYYTGAGEGSEWGSYNWQVDFGFGLAFYTPIGIPLRFDIARSITDYQGWKWAIYFGN